MITTETPTTAEPTTIHALLTDVDAWAHWSPHVASVECDSRQVESGWVGETRAFFAPSATTMIVDEVRPDGGYRWHSTVGPWRLEYDNAVEPTGVGSMVRFTATLHGPASTLIERVVAPLSARGQRRRMQRLADLGELVERQRT